MAPLPKRKHSTQRKGKRMAARKIKLPDVVVCGNCKGYKLPHRVCPSCGK